MKERNAKTSTTKIRDFKYINNDYLEEVVLEEGITHIGERAFKDCKKLRKIKLPDSITYIGPGAFSGCENLEEIVLPAGIKRIPSDCFANCRRLKRVIIPNNVQGIGRAAFTGCDSLEEITIPESVTTLDKQVFLNCQNLKIVNLPDNFTSLPDELFRKCPNLEIELSPKIKTLGARVFEKCYHLSHFPENVISFGEDCFKNCRNLTDVRLNDKTTELSDGMFDGCIRLTSIKSKNKRVAIGKRTFKDCISLKQIPEFVKEYNDRAFENCKSLTSINLTYPYIPFACFRRCSNLKEIKNIEHLRELGPYALSGCGFEEIDISHVNKINPEILSDSKKLKKVKFSPMVRVIGPRALFNCASLESIDFPAEVETIKKEAFMHCDSVKEITIPSELKVIGDGAFSYMDSLERLNVSPRNKVFMTPDHKVLIREDQQNLVLYASGIKDKTYSIKDYVIEIDEFAGRSITRPVSYVGPYAFAGAKNLEELTLCACTKDVEKSAFTGCPKLKKLNLFSGDFFTCPGISLKNHGRYYYEEKPPEEAAIPFEEVEFQGDVVNIFPRALQGFRKVKKITLPRNKKYVISGTAFEDCSSLKEIDIPNQVSQIDTKAFPPTTKLIFENGISTENLVSLIENNKYFGDYKLYILKDGKYYIEQDGKITTLTKKEVEETCTNSHLIADNPVLFLDFTNCLAEHDMAYKEFFDGVLMKNMSLENREILYKYFQPGDLFFLDVLRSSRLLEDENEDTKTVLKDKNFLNFIKYVKILRDKNLDLSLLSNRKLIAHLDPEEFKKLVAKDSTLLTKIIIESSLLECEPKEVEKLANSSLENGAFTKFMELVKKYGIRDRFFYNRAFIACANNPLLEELFRVYDANTKRLLKESKVFDDENTAYQNLSDLLILMKISGALEENQQIRQKAATFITEKILADKLPNGADNHHKIVGDDIHRVFNFQNEIAYNKEFAEFFLENYHELIKDERKKSGFIQRVYANFKEITKTSTSNKGFQRRLKVTLEKCRNYLSNVKFDGVNSKNKELAYLIGAWYDKNETWQQAQRIYQESQQAPRNIFTKVTIDEDGKVIYDNDPAKDLKEEGTGFTYEWLPKQDYDNLVLGKYCSCCAHVEGAGQGIMRASMITNNCQNLVIRNAFGEIVAKATLYVNGQEGYAVFNNVESSLDYKTDEYLRQIYEALLRGANAFLEEYNKNNPKEPINEITIGGARNTILNQMTIENHPIVKIHQAINFGNYSLRQFGYAGDWSYQQRLLIKRKQGKPNE